MKGCTMSANTRPAQSAKRTRPIAVPSGTEQLSPYVTYEQLEGLGILFARKTLRRLCKAGKFPRPVELSPGRIAWRLSDVRDYQDNRPTPKAYGDAEAAA
jgi:predicted DNA-binding transcriptional regulator AlpA